MRDVISLCWYVPWLQEGGQVCFVGSASVDGLVSQRTHTWTHYLPLPTYQPARNMSSNY